MTHSKLDFEYQEDRKYFEDLFYDVGGLDSNLIHFDFRAPIVKRKEFKRIRNSIIEKLKSIHGDICQLRCHPECERIGTQVDHIIPLSTNILNKQIRGMKGFVGKKVKTQSFGSNHKANLVLACSKCNLYKKHRLPTKEQIKSIKTNVNYK